MKDTHCDNSYRYPCLGAKILFDISDCIRHVALPVAWPSLVRGSPESLARSCRRDAELSCSDGRPRSYRSFVFGSPFSVQRPGNLACIQLVDRLERSRWKRTAAVIMPIRIDTAWSQKQVSKVQARVALPTNHSKQVGKIEFRLTDLNGKRLDDFEACKEIALQPNGDFRLRLAEWPADLATPGTY